MRNIELKTQWINACRPPEGWSRDDYFISSEKDRIRYNYAPAHGDAPAGTVVLTHGYGENVDLYWETIRRYQARGFEVFAMDWQGHGKSGREDPDDPRDPGTRGLHPHVQDLHDFIERIVKPRRRAQDGKLLMSTNSMGGHIGLLYLQEHPDVFDGAIMSTPMFDIRRFGLPACFRPAFKAIFNAASFLGLKNVHLPGSADLLRTIDRVSASLRNPDNLPATPLRVRHELVTAMQKRAPETTLGVPTFGWIASAFETIERSLGASFLRSVKTPVLLGSAGHEALVDNTAISRAAALMQKGREVHIKDATHGLWFDTDENYDKWWREIDRFIDDLGTGDIGSRAPPPHPARR